MCWSCEQRKDWFLQLQSLLQHMLDQKFQGFMETEINKVKLFQTLRCKLYNAKIIQCICWPSLFHNHFLIEIDLWPHQYEQVSLIEEDVWNYAKLKQKKRFVRQRFTFLCCIRYVIKDVRKLLYEYLKSSHGLLFIERKLQIKKFVKRNCSKELPEDYNFN